MDPSFATITLPDGRHFAAPSLAVMIQWATERRVPAEAIITEAGRPPLSLPVTHL